MNGDEREVFGGGRHEDKQKRSPASPNARPASSRERRNAPRGNRIVWVILFTGVCVVLFLVYNMGNRPAPARGRSDNVNLLIQPAANPYSDASLTQARETGFSASRPPEPPTPLSAAPVAAAAAPEPRRPAQAVESKAYENSLNMRLSALAANPVVDLRGTRPSTAVSPAARSPEAGASAAASYTTVPPAADAAGRVNLPWDSQRAADADGNSTAMAHQDRNSAFVASQSRTGDGAASEYLPTTRHAQASPFELKAGSIVSGVLIGGINSDTPGAVLGQISENIYDTATGKYLLIPQGARVLGVYDSHVVYGQHRVLVVWQRIIYPDGSSLNIGGMVGSDPSGYAGFKQKVDNHYSRLIGAALLASVFTAAGKAATENDRDSDGNETVMAESVMQTMANFGATLAEKNMNVAPTLRILPGYRFSIMTTKDIAFAEPYVPLI
jgi:type IV secretion system protein VirB10